MTNEERAAWAAKRNSECLKKAEYNEPVFVLLARDATAQKTVLSWIADNLHREPAKLRDAFECMLAMKQYREDNAPKDCCMQAPQ